MGLANALFLAGLLAAAIPVVIHMTRSRKYRHVAIGTLRFLESVVRESRRVRKVENWPLLLARVGVVALLALLFARPFLREYEQDEGERGETLVMLDASGSLAGPAAERVRNAVSEIEAKLPPGSTLTLAAFSDRTRLLGSLDDYDPQPGAPTDYGQAIDWIVERLQMVEQPSTKVILVSDLQKSSLPAAPPRLWPGSALVDVETIPVAGEWNACVERVELITPYLADEIAVEARVKIYGTAGKGPVSAALELESGEKIRAPLPTPQGGRVTFRWEPGEQTEFRGRVTLESSDAWPVDDSRPFVFHLRKQRRVLLIDGDPGPTPFVGEAYYLQKALNASGATHGQSPFRAALRLDLSDRDGVLDLSGWDAIVCCNLERVSGPEARALSAAAENGTGLLFALGEKADPAGYTPLQTLGLFPEHFDLGTGAVPRFVTVWDSSHPTLSHFEAADLRRLLLRDAFVFDPDQAWQVVGEFENNHPVLLAKKAGAAPILVFANPLNREWSDFPVNRLFVPLMREWAVHLTGLQRMEREVRIMHPGLDDSREPGLYEENGEGVELITAQPLEMDPAVADLETFRSALAIPESSPQLALEPPGAPPDRERPNEWWPWVLLLLIVILAVENYFADRVKSNQIEPPTPTPHEI